MHGKMLNPVQPKKNGWSTPKIDMCMYVFVELEPKIEAIPMVIRCMYNSFTSLSICLFDYILVYIFVYD